MKNFSLSDDEKIIYEIKPNKKRFVWIQTLFICLLNFVIIGICAIVVAINVLNKQPIANCLVSFIVIGICFISSVISCAGCYVRYKKRLYCVTNKRLIITSGFIGVDYKSMFLDTIMSQDVRVDFLDKCIKPNTGTIYFANPSAPVVHNNYNDKGRTSTFCFSSIDNPYDWFNKIKEVIDLNRKKY